jgi:Tfp pilus assembly protein PilF
LALEAYPESADLHNGFGSALQAQGHLDLATREFARTVELNARFAEAHNNLGLAFLSTGQREHAGQAEQEFETAIFIDPHDADAEINLGTLYGQQGKDAEAERLFREALKSNPGFTKALVNLGATVAGESRFTEADTVLQQALQIEPGNKEAQELRPMIKVHGSE